MQIEKTLKEAAKLNFDNKTSRLPIPTSHWINSEFLQIQNFIEGAKWQQERMYSEEEEPKQETSKVTRVEVIQHSPPYNGRVYTNYNAKDVEILFQDDGRTLKIFLK